MSNLSSLYFVNYTPDVIHIRVTFQGQTTHRFFDLNPNVKLNWDRAGWEVAYIIRSDNSLQEWAVNPGVTYNVYPNYAIVESQALCPGT